MRCIGKYENDKMYEIHQNHLESQALALNAQSKFNSTTSMSSPIGLAMQL